MPETRVAAAPPERDLAEYYHWEEPGRGIRIYMHAAMAERLQQKVFQAAGPMAGGCAEIGGILLGWIEAGDGGEIRVIEDFIAVGCSHVKGPRFSLSDRDIVGLEETLLQTALAGCESRMAPSVIGYFRSHNRDGVSLSQEDITLIETYFPAPSNVFLIVKPVRSTNTCTAGFFFWEDGRLQPDFSPLEVALGRLPSAPAVSYAARVSVADPPGAGTSTGLDEALPANLAKLFSDFALPKELEAGVANRLWIWLGRWRSPALRFAAVSLTAFLLGFLTLVYLSARRSGHSEASMLGLQIEPRSHQLLVTWSRTAPQILTARRATLSIDDGKAHRILQFDPVQLATGSVLYTPVGDEIQFRLDVFSEKERLAQSVLFLGK